MINIDGRFYIRKEENGITLFDLFNDIYVFFEEINYNEFLKLNDKVKLIFLKENKNKISKNIILTRPFRINWVSRRTM